MCCVKPIFVVLLAGLLWIGATAPLAAQNTAPSQAPLKARPDEAIGQLATYDFGGDSAALNTLSDLALATHGKPQERQQLVAALAGVLRSGAPQGAKDFACRQLALVGTAEAVPALAGLLADEPLSHMARFALERIPGPEAEEALCQALGKVKGRLLVGVVNSLGNRRDPRPAGALAGLLGDADPAVAAAAAAALGKIGPSAAEGLTQALGRASGPVRSAVADACLVSADALRADGKTEASLAIYDCVRKAEVPTWLRMAATRGAILARQSAGIPLLVEQIRGAEPWQFALGVSLARQLPGPEVTKAVASELGRLPPPKQIALVTALADRGDRAAASVVLPLAEASDAAVRSAATRALGVLGDAAAVPILFRAATGSDAELAQSAKAALASLPGKEIDAAVIAAAAGREPALRALALEALGRRHVATAVPLLLGAAADPDGAIRLAAMKALGETAGRGEFDALVGLLVGAGAAAELTAMEETVGSVYGRLAEKGPAAERLLAALPKASPAAKAALVRLLGVAGGAKALEAVLAAIADSDQAVQDTAVRTLANWPDPSAAEHLLKLAKTSPSPKHRILALQGYVRQAGQVILPNDRRLAMCKEALALASRNEEKRLVLGALGGIHTPDALAVVVSCLDTPCKEEAAAAAVSIGERIAASHRAPVAEAMSKVLAVTKNVPLKKRAGDLLAQTKSK